MPLLVASTIAVLALSAGALGWATVRRRTVSRIDSPEDAAEAAEHALPGFVVTGAVVGADGAGALAVAAGGRVAAMVRSGRRMVTREVEWRAIRSTAHGVVVETGDRRLGEVLIAGVDVLDIRRLAPGQRG